MEWLVVEPPNDLPNYLVSVALMEWLVVEPLMTCLISIVMASCWFKEGQMVNSKVLVGAAGNHFNPSKYGHLKSAV